MCIINSGDADDGTVRRVVRPNDRRIASDGRGMAEWSDAKKAGTTTEISSQSLLRRAGLPSGRALLCRDDQATVDVLPKNRRHVRQWLVIEVRAT